MFSPPRRMLHHVQFRIIYCTQTPLVCCKSELNGVCFVFSDGTEEYLGGYDEASIRYMGRNIPSRSFRMLQNMTGGADPAVTPNNGKKAPFTPPSNSSTVSLFPSPTHDYSITFSLSLNENAVHHALKIPTILANSLNFFHHFLSLFKLHFKAPFRYLSCSSWSASSASRTCFVSPNKRRRIAPL